MMTVKYLLCGEFNYAFLDTRQLFIYHQLILQSFYVNI